MNGMNDILTRKLFLNYSFIEESSSLLTNCSDNCSSTDATPIQEIPLNYVKIIVLSVIILLTFLGNVAIIFAIAARRSKLTRMYYFILHLSIADLLTAFLTLLPEVIWTFTLPHFYGGVVMCKIIKFTQMLGPYLSSYILIMTAVDRYQAICNPLGNCTWTPKRSQVRPNFPYLKTSRLILTSSYTLRPIYEISWRQNDYLFRFICYHVNLFDVNSLPKWEVDALIVICFG